VGGQALVFRADPHLCAVGLEHVAEVTRPLPAEPLGGAPPFVRGVCVLRGDPAPVVSLRTLIRGTATGGSSGAADRPVTRFVSVYLGAHRVALAVEEVLGVREIPLDLLHDLSSVLGPATSEVVSAVGAVGGEPLLFLSVTRVVPDSVWSALEQDRADR
jgi:purine-binding chemotaxis protein CheW